MTITEFNEYYRLIFYVNERKTVAKITTTSQY